MNRFTSLRRRLTLVAVSLGLTALMVFAAGQPSRAAVPPNHNAIIGAACVSSLVCDDGQETHGKGK
ncbi:MAG: hypothetical protein KGJ62_03540 [Armatimonadetes bacterium]|nr:hypothetical protein [Armatimonadota bacterium]MDE2206075.1 hypothetical protein [Armatimonadota bacterium]